MFELNVSGQKTGIYVSMLRGARGAHPLPSHLSRFLVLVRDRIKRGLERWFLQTHSSVANSQVMHNKIEGNRPLRGNKRRLAVVVHMRL